MPTLRLMSLLLFCANCSSPSLWEKTFSEGQRRGNIYRIYFEEQDSQHKKIMRSSAFHLFRATLLPFHLSLENRAGRQGLLRHSPHTLVHGDFHVQQMAWLEGKPGLDDFDTADHGPWWLDVLRLETSVQVLARQRGWSNEVEGGECWQGYMSGLAGLEPQTSWKPQGPPTQPIPRDHRQEPTWIQARAEVPQAEQEALRSWLLSLDGPTQARKVGEIRRGHSGVGSYTHPKFFGLNQEGRLLELKQQSANPLKELKMAHDAGRMDACTRWKTATQAYGPGQEFLCWEHEGKSYGLIPWVLNYWSPDAEHFDHVTALRGHAAWMCHELALVHQKFWNETQLKTLRVSLEHNPQFRRRVLQMAKKEASSVDEAYRMILLKEGPTARTLE